MQITNAQTAELSLEELESIHAGFFKDAFNTVKTKTKSIGHTIKDKTKSACCKALSAMLTGGDIAAFFTLGWVNTAHHKGIKFAAKNTKAIGDESVAVMKAANAWGFWN